MALPINWPPKGTCLRRKAACCYGSKGILPLRVRRCGNCSRMSFGLPERRAAKRSSKVRSRLMVAMTAFTVVLPSSVALAQNSKQGPQKDRTPAGSNKPFDAHDLSGLLGHHHHRAATGRPERNEQQSAANDAVGPGKVSQDKDGIRCQVIRQRSCSERKRLERSGPVVRSDRFPTHPVGPHAARK